MKEKEPFKITGISQEEMDQARQTGEKENERERKEFEEISKNKKTPIKELLDIKTNLN